MEHTTPGPLYLGMLGVLIYKFDLLTNKIDFGYCFQLFLFCFRSGA